MADEKHDDCDCCVGLTARTPVLIYNRPGLSAIRYRVGTYSRFKQSMISGLSDPNRTALRDLKTRDDDDFSLALLDAWAVVSDVLSFYQERIANESYLRTSTETNSIIQLARLIGYELRPGVASSAYLAFNMESAEGAPESAIIDAGTKVQSIPGQGQLPKTFETLERIEAKGCLNELRPLLTGKQDVTFEDSTDKVYFEGTSIGLLPEDGLLFNLTPGEEFFCQVESVELIPENDQTEVTIHRKIRLRSGALLDDEYQKKFPESTDVEKGIMETVDKQYAALDKSPKSIETIQNTNYISVNEGPWIKSENARVFKNVYDIDVLKQLESHLALPKQAVFLKQKETNLAPPKQVDFLKQLESYLALPNQESVNLPTGVTAFQSRAYIFGHNAPRFDSMPDSQASIYASREDSWVDMTLDRYHYQGERDLSETNLLLDNVYPVEKGGLIILRDGDECLAYNVKDIREVTASDFTLAAKVSALSLGGNSDAFSKFWIRGTTVFCRGTKLKLAKVSANSHISGGTIDLDLNKNLDGLKGRSIIICGELDEDLKQSVKFCELTTVSDVSHSLEGITTIQLKEGLKGKYLRDTTTIYANVALATEGETREEVLGSGNASEAFQKFKLRETPLTYISAKSGSGSASTLKIFVGGVQWHEVGSLYGCKPRDKVFQVRIDGDEKAIIEFGDGINGSRLPTGQEIRAVYRKGLGREGNIDADKLSLLLTMPLGLRGVKNPIPASGGADHENLDEARTNAPLEMFTLGRLVSLRDYEDFARAFAGIGKALATWTWNGQVRGIFITIAGQGGDDVRPDSLLFANLQAEMQRAGDASIPIEIRSYRKSFFRIGASIKIDPDYRTEKVLLEVRDSVLAKFSFNARSFGQAVKLGEVMAVIQSVPGVTAVEISKLYKVPGISAVELSRLQEEPIKDAVEPNRLAKLRRIFDILSKESKLEMQINASAPQAGEKAESVVAAELLTIDQNQPFDSLGVIL